MVTAPLLVLLYDRTFLVGSVREALRRRWPLYAGLAASWIVLQPTLVLLFFARPQAAEGTSSVGFAQPWVTTWGYTRSQPGVILHYLRLALWPDRLCLDYAWPVARTAAEILPAALVVGGLLLATLWGLLRRSWLGFVGAWFFLILAPTSSVVPLFDLAVEHRMYLPLAAVVVLAVLGGQAAVAAVCRRLAPGGRGRLWLAGGLVAGLVLVLGTRTQWRNDDYRDAVAMWADVAAQQPQNARARNNLGGALYARGYREQAARLFREAVLLNPNCGEAHANLGLLAFEAGAVERAVTEYRLALRLRPHLQPAHYKLGVLLIQRGDLEQAERHLGEAVRLDATDHLAHGTLGRLRLLQGRWEEAATCYRQAIALYPQEAGYHCGLAFALAHLDRAAEARQEYKESLRLEPDWPLTHLRQAWDLATSPDPDRRCGSAAVLQALQAVAVGREDAEALDVLAAAYAEAGQFREAADAARRAGAALSDPQLARAVEERRQLYQAGRPFHAPVKHD
jgi:Flp pilus assembly protein TadD